jgi:homoaconitase/3-isopropylmalate dehydratase large subunit
MAIIKANNQTLSGITSLPTGLGGKVVAVALAEQTSSYENSSNSYSDVTGLSLSYTMQSSSNKIIFTVLGSIQRGSQDGGIGSVLEFDNNEITETKIEDPACADNTYLPYGSAIIDGYSGAKTFKAKARSTPNNNKVLSRIGSTLMVMEYTP